MAKKKKRSLGKAMEANTEKQTSKGSGFGYLNLPEGIEKFKLKGEKDERVNLAILMYEVQMKEHADRNDDQLVATPDSEWYRFPFFVHDHVGENDAKVVCLKTFGKKCPICDYQNKLQAEGKPWAERKAYTNKPRALYIVVPMNCDYMDVKHYVLDSSVMLTPRSNNVQKEINSELKEHGGQVFDLFDEIGFIPLATRWEPDSFNKNKFASLNRASIEKKYKKAFPVSKKLLKDVPNPETMLKVLSYKEIEKMHSGGMDADDEVYDDPKEDGVIIRDDLKDAAWDELCEMAMAEGIKKKQIKGLDENEKALRNLLADKLGLKKSRKKKGGVTADDLPF